MNIRVVFGNRGIGRITILGCVSRGIFVREINRICLSGFGGQVKSRIMNISPRCFHPARISLLVNSTAGTHAHLK